MGSHKIRNQNTLLLIFIFLYYSQITEKIMHRILFLRIFLWILLGTLSSMFLN